MLTESRREVQVHTSCFACVGVERMTPGGLSRLPLTTVAADGEEQQRLARRLTAGVEGTDCRQERTAAASLSAGPPPLCEKKLSSAGSGPVTVSPHRLSSITHILQITAVMPLTATTHRLVFAMLVAGACITHWLPQRYGPGVGVAALLACTHQRADGGAATLVQHTRTWSLTRIRQSSITRITLIHPALHSYSLHFLALYSTRCYFPISLACIPPSLEAKPTADSLTHTNYLSILHTSPSQRSHRPAASCCCLPAPAPA